MIAWTRVETIGRCLPPESGKFCTLFYSRRLLVLQDNDPAGVRASRRLVARASEAGIASAILRPVLKDFNADLRLLGRDVLAEHLRRQVPDLVIEDG